GARDEVDRFRFEAGRAGVAGSEIGDPETFLELAERRDRAAQRTQVVVLNSVEQGERLVDELDPRARADVDQNLPRHTQRRIRERNSEIPARAELIEDRILDRPPERLEVLARPRELAPHDRFAA